MELLPILSIFNYGLVLIYGLLLCVNISGGCNSFRQKKLVFLLGFLLLFVQIVCSLIWSTDIVKKVYPLIVHLPLTLLLIFALKKKPFVSLISVCTAYLCCQLPRWTSLVSIALTNSLLVGEITYTLFIFPIYILLHRYFVRIAYDVMTYSKQNTFLFGSLPLAYYFFDYTTVIYSNALYEGSPLLTEFLPTALIIFYVIFFAFYHAQTQKRLQAELQGSALELSLKQFSIELDRLRHQETRTAIYRHDMRHHLAIMEGFLSANNIQQAQKYIKHVQTDIESITPKSFCENELVNLLCSSFFSKAQQKNIRLDISVILPPTLSIPDSEFCAILSNALENALKAVENLDESQREVALYCRFKTNKLLIEVKNPYAGKIRMQDGLPISSAPRHGYGCRSILSIAERHHGHCSFEANKHIFTMRVMIPLREKH